MGWDAGAKKTRRAKRALIVWLTALLVMLPMGETRGGNLLAASTIELGQKTIVSYEAYGTRTAEQGSSEDRQKANTKDEDPTGLLNEGMRYRCLTTGVFLTRDPAGFVDGPNVYTYVRQNPWTKFDPFGLYEDDWQRMGQEKDLYGVNTYKELTDLHAKSSAKTVSLISDFIPVIGPMKAGIETASEIKENGLSKEIVLGSLTDQALKRLGMKGKGTEVATALSSKSAKQTKKQAEKLTNKATNLQTGAEKASKSTDIKVIGRQNDTAVAKDWDGHDVLNDPNWTLKRNDGWVADWVKNKQEFYTATPEAGNMVQTSGKFKGQPTVYARELKQIQEAGYVKKGDSYFHPGNVPKD